MDQKQQQQNRPDVVLDRIEGGLAWLFGGYGPTNKPAREQQTQAGKDEEVTGHDR